MKKLFAIIIASVMVTAFAIVSSACAPAQDTLQVYTNAGFAPFEYVDEKANVVGVDIDIMKAIGKELGYKVVINDIEFEQILKEVEKNELAVGAAGMSKKAECDEVALASIVYATSVQYVIAPNGTFLNDSVVTMDELYATIDKIGAQKGTTGYFLLEETFAEEDIIQFSNAIIASGDIGSTVEAVVIDELPAKSIAAANADLSCWKIDAEPESYVLYFNKSATELVEKVNKVLGKMIEDGTIDQYIINHSNGK